MKKKVLVTGSAGLIGSEAVRYYCQKGFEVYPEYSGLQPSCSGIDPSNQLFRRLGDCKPE
jgi:nucleoside-diphosphate-sugar epimerase